MKQIKAKFASKCTETGATIRKGDVMIYDYSSRKCYSIHSETGKKFIEDEDQDQAAGYIAAHENAYFDNFCSNNNI